jgi:hypothetical protein
VSDLQHGLYEVLVAEALSEALAYLDYDLVVTRALKAYDAPDRVALHLANLIRGSLSGVSEGDRETPAIAAVAGDHTGFAWVSAPDARRSCCQEGSETPTF